MSDNTQWRIEHDTMGEVKVPADALYREAYLPRHLLQVGSIDALSWLTLGLGMLALLIHLQLRESRLYLWYGLTCLLVDTDQAITRPRENWLLLWLPLGCLIAYEVGLPDRAPGGAVPKKI